MRGLPLLGHYAIPRLARVGHCPLTAPAVLFLCSGSTTIQRRKTTVPEARYRLFRRASGMYYQQDHETKVQVSLRTKDKHAAQEKVRAANESVAQPRLNLDLARVYLKAYDTEISERTWAMVMAVYSERGRDTSQKRCQRAFAGRDFDPIRNLLLINTKAEDLLRVLASGKTSVSHYLRRLVHHAEDLNWLPWTIMARAAWPKINKQPKRGITAEEHQRILDAEERNPERRAYYQMVWMTGGSQGDIARLRAENVQTQVLAYQRSKLPEDAQPARLKIGPTMQQLLDQLPKTGWLFPKIALMESKQRAAEFRRRCGLLKIKDISLHSYRYGWAGRAAQVGYPQRYAQAAFGPRQRGSPRGLFPPRCRDQSILGRIRGQPALQGHSLPPCCRSTDRRKRIRVLMNTRILVSPFTKIPLGFLPVHTSPCHVWRGRADNFRQFSPDFPVPEVLLFCLPLR